MNVNSQKLEVKNKNAAEIQITAEQLINEALELEEVEKKVNYNLIDEDELNEYKVNKRKEFEDAIRKRRYQLSAYVKYALWEINQKDITRARSIFERALNVDYTNRNIWLKYIEVELTNKNINSARNLFDRVIALLPLENIFWKKYAHLEEILNNFVNTRIIYERWIKWNIDETAYLCYINFEERCKELDKCREIFKKLIINIPKVECFYKFIKFEKKHKNIEAARECFEKCIELFPPEFLDEHFYISFGEFEEENHEYERCKHIYIEALKRIPKEKSRILYRKFLQFQKKYASKDELDQTILLKERHRIEEELKKTPEDYDLWYDYIKLEESHININSPSYDKVIIRIRDIYERAIGHIPPISVKKYWKRYIYLWINYAIFEELYANNINRARNVYSNILKLLNKRNIIFKKIYILYATFEIRQLDVERARKIYNEAIEEVKKEKIFEHYCETELRLGNIEDCRYVYQRYVETFPFSPQAWISMINFELSLEETERARQIAEIAINLDDMKFPELLWKCYIDMEINLNEYKRVEKLYERLLNITQHYKVYKSYAQFEYIYMEDVEKSRCIIENGLEFCKKNELPVERNILLKFLYEIEKDFGDKEMILKTRKRLPKKVKKKIYKLNGSEKVVDDKIIYIFPEDGPQQQNVKILQKALQWKKEMEEKQKNKEKEENSEAVTANDV